jgi:hypothetical protein
MDLGERRNNSTVGREMSLVREKVGLGRFEGIRLESVDGEIPST